MFLTETEIMSQHEALAQTYAYMAEQAPRIQAFFAKNTARRFVFIGCGSSYMLSKSAERAFNTRPNTSAVALAGGDYLVNPDAWSECVKGSIVVALSRSGRTSEIDRALTLMKQRHGVPVVSITMTEQNPIADQSDLALILPWAYDNSVCQTRTVTNIYASVLLLAAACYGDSELTADIGRAVQSNEAFKLENRAALEAIAKEHSWKNATVLADGIPSGIAQEGALAFTEIAMIPGQSFNLLDYRHGPMVLNTRDTLTIILVQNGAREYQRAMIDDLKTHGGTIVTVSSEEENIYGVDLNICIKALTRFETWGIPFIYVPQMIAFAKAISMGGNPDQPTGLDAFITLK